MQPCLLVRAFRANIARFFLRPRAAQGWGYVRGSAPNTPAGTDIVYEDNHIIQGEKIMNKYIIKFNKNYKQNKKRFEFSSGLNWLLGQHIQKWYPHAVCLLLLTASHILS